MSTRWRLAVAGCVLVAALALVFVWLPSTRGHLEGTVHFVGCSGAAQKPLPGQPPVSTCNSVLVSGATVMAVPGSVARFDRDQTGHLIVVPSKIGSVSVRSDAQGRFQLDLAPGTYMIGASETGSRADEGNGIWEQLPPAISSFREIQIVGATTIKGDITIPFFGV
jgi:hypothetical protein